MNYTPTEKPQWYVAHTYSGYENKVKAGIEATVENRNMQDQIFEVRVPTQKVIEKKNGESKVTEKKIFPGYVLVKMFMNNDSWYVVRNTRGVTGFVGPASEPVPLSEEELRSMGIRQEPVVVVQYKVGDTVSVLDGPMKGFSGTISEVKPEQSKVKVNISMFGGRETPTELGFDEIQLIKNS